MEKKSTYEMDRNSELTIPTDWSNKSSDFSTIDSHSITGTDLPKKQPPSFDSSISLTRTQIWSGLVENSSRNTAQIQPKLATVYTPNMFGQNFKKFPQYVWHLQNFQILFGWPMASKISNFVQTDMASKTDFFFLFYQVLRTTRLIHGSAKTFCELLR